MARAPELLAGDLFRVALHEERGLTIVEHPSYALKRSIPHDFTPKGMYANGRSRLCESGAAKYSWRTW